MHAIYKNMYIVKNIVPTRLARKSNYVDFQTGKTRALTIESGPMENLFTVSYIYIIHIYLSMFYGWVLYNIYKLD